MLDLDLINVILLVAVLVIVIYLVVQNNNEKFYANITADDGSAPACKGKGPDAHPHCHHVSEDAWNGDFQSKFCKKIRKKEKGEDGWPFPLDDASFTHAEEKHKRSNYPNGKRYLGASCDNKCKCCNQHGIEHPHIKAQCCEMAKRIKGSDLAESYGDVDNDLRFPTASECLGDIGGSGLSL